MRLAYQVRMQSSEAARKEWGTNQTAALEAFVKYDLGPKLLAILGQIDEHRNRLCNIEAQMAHQRKPMAGETSFQGAFRRAV